jgi:hypothetical protein
MRYLVDLAVFALVFVVALAVFHNSTIALLAAVIVAGAAEVLQGSAAKR